MCGGRADVKTQSIFHRTAKVSKHLINQTFDFMEINNLFFTHTWSGLTTFFKTLSTSDSKVFFLWFETDINRIPSSPQKTMMNIFVLLEWIKLLKNSHVLFATPHPQLHLHFSGWVQIAPEINLKWPPILKNYVKSPTVIFYYIPPLQLGTQEYSKQLILIVRQHYQHLRFHPHCCFHLQCCPPKLCTCCNICFHNRDRTWNMIVVLESSCNFFVNMASPSHTCNESFAVSFRVQPTCFSETLVESGIHL